MSTINELRTHLFETLAALRDKANPLDVDRAEAIAKVAQVVINSAIVETRYLELTGQQSASGFIPTQSKPHTLPAVPPAGAKVERLMPAPAKQAR